MRLFDEIERTETRPRNEREPTFDYWNISAREPIEVLREIVQEWFDSYPADAQKDLCARFRSPIDAQHQAAFWELYLHELFSGMGYRLEVHPTVVGTPNHPDYLVYSGKEPTFYLEATVAGLPSQEGAGAEARLAEVLDLVNKLEDPNFVLELQHSGLPGSPPPCRELLPRLEAWLNTLEPGEIEKTWKDNDFDNLPRFEWSHDGLTLSFAPIPRSSGMSTARTLAITMGEGHMITPDEDMRHAIGRKAKKYGELSLPLVVAVNYLGDHCDAVDINNALFGSETIKVFGRRDGSYDWHPGHRQPNGVWFGRKGPRNLNLSGILIANALNPYSAGTTTPQLFHNPYLDKMISLPFYPLPQSVPDKASQTMQTMNGKEAKEFLRLPSTWPPTPD